MRTLTEKYFGGLPLEKEEYEADFAVVDKYQSFSAELLRLSLLGLAGYGFLIANIVLKATSGAQGEMLLRVFLQTSTISVLSIGAVALGIAAATALGHRYFATDCITHFVRRLRAGKRYAALPEGDTNRAALAHVVMQEQNSLERDVRLCRWLLVSASLFLIVGAACVALSFASTLLGARSN